MSCITENTVIVEAKSKQSMLNDLTAYGCGDSVYIVYCDDNFVICNFDCNGDSPWDILDNEELELAWDAIIALETNYGDGDGYWTQIITEEYGACVFDGELLDWLHNILTEEEYSEVKPLIAYTF